MSAADSSVDRLRLARTEGVGPIAYRRLLRRYGSAAAALAALPDLAQAGGRSAAPTTPTRSEAEREIEQLARFGARFLFVDAPDYPPLLALLDDPPPVLALLGQSAALQDRAVALVGGRNASVNGQRIAEDLAAELARAGLCVVSGLARGIDAAAHAGALAVGRTVAVVAGGARYPLPARTRRSAAPHRRNRSGLGGTAAGHGAAGAAFPPPQSDHRRPCPGRRGGRGGPAFGQLDHRAGWPRKPGAKSSPYPAPRSIRAVAAPTT